MSNERLNRLPFDKVCKIKNILYPAKSFSMHENPYFSEHIKHQRLAGALKII